MNESNKTPLVIAFIVVVLLFLIFGGGQMTGCMMSGGMMGTRMDRRVQLDVDSYHTYPRSRCPTWLGYLGQENVNGLMDESPGS